jgi:hypothetical protein
MFWGRHYGIVLPHSIHGLAMASCGHRTVAPALTKTWRLKMTDNATIFLAKWCKTHVETLPYFMHKEVASQHADLCTAQAEDIGITPRELAKAAGGNLKRHLMDASADAQDAVVKSRAK